MSKNPYPIEQRENLIAEFQHTLRRSSEELDLPLERAFIRVALDSLGYDFDENHLSDGKGDFGVDYWEVADRNATIMQFKSIEFEGTINHQAMIGPNAITDISRIFSLIESLEAPPTDANRKTRAFMKELRSAIYRQNPDGDKEGYSFSVCIYFVCLAKGMTSQATQEFKALQQRTQFNLNGRLIEVTTISVFLDDLLADFWREKNAEWRTSNGEKDDRIELDVCGQMLDSAKSLVFFTKAHNLVEAYDKFGYQIFEPNVRCELKRSRVNEAIRASIQATRGRKEFKHLNNGITLICASFQKVKQKDGFVIRIRQPGVINGLQTVKSIHDAFDELDEGPRADFVEKCELLVRVHTRESVSDYRELVKSTNNQNPMQPRNLRSNDPEQLNYERLFSNLKWFYERKEGAWQAFKSDHSLWGTLKEKKPTDFTIGRGQARSLDNLDMAQAWLSFVGFSDEAIHNKKDIFSEDRYYEMVFKKRIVRHGLDYGLKFSNSAISAEASDQAPNHRALLLAYLLREWADGLTPTRKQHRDECVKRLKLDRLRKEDQDAKLAEDPTYIRGLVLSGAKYLFADFCGLILFRALGAEMHNQVGKLLETRSIIPLFMSRDVEPANEKINSGDFSVDDPVPVLWSLYLYCLSNIIEMPNWRQQFEQAAVRSRFNYSDFNRNALFNQLDSIDKVYQRRPLPTEWSEGLETHKGIFNCVRAALT